MYTIMSYTAIPESKRELLYEELVDTYFQSKQDLLDAIELILEKEVK